MKWAGVALGMEQSRENCHKEEYTLMLKVLRELKSLFPWPVMIPFPQMKAHWEIFAEEEEKIAETSGISDVFGRKTIIIRKYINNRQTVYIGVSPQVWTLVMKQRIVL